MKNQPPIRVIGLRAQLCGAGMDAAELVTDGVHVLEPGRTACRAFSDEERAAMMAGGDKAAAVAENAAAELLDRFDPPDLVGWQRPVDWFDAAKGRISEIGSGALLAQAAGVPVAWDFLSTDLQMGGIGLTVPAAFSWALAARANTPMIHLDLGTRALMAVADPAQDWAKLPDALRAAECGLGFGALNALQAEDAVGWSWPEGGTVVADIPEVLLEHAFFARMPPKLAPAELTEKALLAVTGLDPADAAATLLAMIAGGVAAVLDQFETAVPTIHVSGRGAVHSELLHMISAATGLDCVSLADLGIDPAMSKAMAVGYLAVRVSRGLPTSGPGTTGVKAAIGGAVISGPEG